MTVATHPSSRLDAAPDARFATAAARQAQAAAQGGWAVFFADPMAAGGAAPELAFIPAGRFVMGAKATEYQVQQAEMPRHEVELPRPFALMRTAVSRRQYNEFLTRTDHRRPRPYASWSDLDFPIFNVTVRDAEAYARWLSEQTGQVYRLPTEAEWEYACRADTDSLFCFGDKVRREEVNCAGGLHCTRGLFICGISRPVRVGSLPANGWGLFEMHGNVQEFTLDHWRNGYRAAPRVGDMPFRSPDAQHRHFRVVRGGSWFDGPGACRSASRAMRHEQEIDLNLGFRLLREIR
ncbi:formylglycine-generating enzyme family protein [Halothiobacillus sp. DCM-1]|uniref:formylglycine-generating enzyme family protein n=1 Tax=Halothiobacillus sp. DCM-1 TaxID=3112558 RepID=UPI00325416D6